MNISDESLIAVTSRSFSKNIKLRAELLKKYKNVRFNDQGMILKEGYLVNFLSGCTKAIVGLEIIDDRLLESLPGLRVISKYGVGLDSIDINALKSRGVLIGWTPGVNKRSVSELTIALMVSLSRQIMQARDLVKQGEWMQLVGSQISGKKIGIIGCGNVGKDLVSLLQPWGCKIFISDIHYSPEFISHYNLIKLDIAELLEISDVVTLHLPLNKSTYKILNKDMLQLMRPDSVLINTARGGLVDEEEVEKMLKDGRLLGAAFDVFETEPNIKTSLLKLPNFLGTPHIGGSAKEAIEAMGMAAIRGLDVTASESIELIRKYGG